MLTARCTSANGKFPNICATRLPLEQGLQQTCFQQKTPPTHTPPSGLSRAYLPHQRSQTLFATNFTLTSLCAAATAQLKTADYRNCLFKIKNSVFEFFRELTLQNWVAGNLNLSLWFMIGQQEIPFFALKLFFVAAGRREKNRRNEDSKHLIFSYHVDTKCSFQYASHF